MKIGWCLLTALCVLPLSLRAQEVTGNLQGQVVTPQAEPVADVRVTVAGPSLQGTRATQADPRGFFQVLALPAGRYTVRLARIGFRPVVIDSVPIRIGATTSLGLVTVEPQAIELGEIKVNALRLSIDPASTTIGANVDAATYDALPVGRDYRSIVAFLPHANTSYYTGDPVNIGGATGLENAYFIDGVNVTDDHFQGVVSTFVLPYNFVRTVEVKEGGYDARYGRAIGGLVNAVTYSGGNTFEGDVFAFFTDRGLTGEQRTGFNDVRSDASRTTTSVRASADRSCATGFGIPPPTTPRSSRRSKPCPGGAILPTSCGATFSPGSSRGRPRRPPAWSCCCSGTARPITRCRARRSPSSRGSTASPTPTRFCSSRERDTRPRRCD